MLNMDIWHNTYTKSYWRIQLHDRESRKLTLYLSRLPRTDRKEQEKGILEGKSMCCFLFRQFYLQSFDFQIDFTVNIH